jgi:hypothetical protein
MHDPGPNRPDASATDTAFWVTPLLFLGGFLVVGLDLALARAVTASRAVGHVRITALPPGEAPEDIRRAWIGLELPIVNGPAEGPVFGVVSHHAARCGAGYAVNGAEAVRRLAAKAPDAAAWWRTNAPHVLTGGYQLVFPADVCERVC